MNLLSTLNDRRHEEIVDWLRRALSGKESLPLATPDELPHLGILRGEKDCNPAVRDSLRRGCVHLLMEFCTQGIGEFSYVNELLLLVADFFKFTYDGEVVHILAQFARKFPELPNVDLRIKKAVLARLVDIRPWQDTEFWFEILAQNPSEFSALALSGVLAKDWNQGIEMLPRMPDSREIGQLATMKLRLTRKHLDRTTFSEFDRKILQTLPLCGAEFKKPILEWLQAEKIC